MRIKLFPGVILVAMFAIANCGVVATAQPLLIDFNSLTQDSGPHPQEGYQSYDAGHEVPADFVIMAYEAFDTAVTLMPSWPDSPTQANTMQSLDRAGGNDSNWLGDKVDLLTDWLGVDTRTANGGNGNFTLEDGGDVTRLTLTLGGLPAGNYDWISYHHDTENIHTQFFAEFSVDGGNNFDVLTDAKGNNLFRMTNSTTGSNPPEDEVFTGDVDADPILLPSTLIWSFSKPDDSDVVITFTPIAHTAVHAQVMGLNGFELYQAPTTEPDGDFDDDTVWGTADIDALGAEIVAGTDNADFDLTEDGAVNIDDQTQWLADAANQNGLSGPYLLGDTDLNGTVNVTDLNALAQNWNQASDAWSGGDFNASGVVDVSDLNALAQNWNQSVPSAAASNAAVPEPTGLFLAAFAVILLCARRRE